MNYNYKSPKNQVVVSVSPNPQQIFTNTRIKIFCYKPQLPIIPINFVAEWKKIGMGVQQIINNHQNSCYECSPLDLGFFIEARFKYEDEGTIQQIVRKFGPVKIQQELASALEKTTIQYFKITLFIENTFIDLNLKISGENLILISKENLEFTIKLDSPLEIQLKHDIKIVNLKLRMFSDALIKYISALLKKFMKYKMDNLDLIFENRSIRDYFLMVLKKVMKRNSNKTNASSYIREKQENNRGRDIINITKRKDNNNNNNNNSSISLSKKKNEKNQRSFKQEKISIKEKNSKTPSVAQKGQYLSVFEEETDIMKDPETKCLFSDFNPKNQAPALNLRESFVELEQRHLNSKSRTDLKTSSLFSEENKQIKNQLEQARNQIKKLMEEISILKEQNNGLKQELSNQNTNKEIRDLKQKLQYLMTENQRLQSQRTQIIADKINSEVKYQRERQQKQILRVKLENLNTIQYNSKFETNQMLDNNTRTQRLVSKSPIKLNHSTNDQRVQRKMHYRQQNQGNNYNNNNNNNNNINEQQNSKSTQNLKRLNILQNHYQ